MKKIYTLLMSALCVLCITSCEGFMDIHKDYIKNGEIIYAPKPDSVSFAAGKERISFYCRAYNSPNVKTVNLYWNDRIDSLIIPVSFNSNYDSIQVILDNMEEKSYTFDIILVDNFGNKSLKVTDFGSAYGDKYQETLRDRRVKDVSISDAGGLVEWYSAPSGLFANEVKYTKRDGSQKTVRMLADKFSVLCAEAKAGESFEYRSLFIPEAASIDTFYTAWTKHDVAFSKEFQLNRTHWSVLKVSDETDFDGGGMHTLLDGDLSTYWQSGWHTGPVPLPHWVIIDLATPKKISRIEIYRRAGKPDTKTVQIFIGDTPDADDSGWEMIGEIVYETGDMKDLIIPDNVNTEKGRYMKLLLPDSNSDPYASLAEIYLYGK